MRKLKILYHIPNPRGLGADRWIYEGWRDAFAGLGHDVFELVNGDDIAEKTGRLQPDIFWTAYNLIDIPRDKDLLMSMRSRGIKVMMRMDWPRKPQEVEVIRNEEIVDLYFDEREPESMTEFERQTGRKYYTVTNAANSAFHFPARPVAKYQYDLVYLGAKLPKKKWFFDNVLIPLSGKYKVGIFGPYWTVKDNVLCAAQKLCLKSGLRPIADVINKFRIVIPPEEENQLYSSAKICLNYHEREEDGSQPHYIVNQRTFKIAACGGFQICDHVPALRKYFDDDEVVMVKDKDDWFRKIDYYLSHEEERRRIQKKGSERALKEHTYNNRVEQVLGLLAGLQ